MMKHVIGLLYLITAFIGLRWAVYLAMTGLYGVPFSPWVLVVLIGGLLLLVGAILWWSSSKSWTQWLPILGSLLLATYFLPGLVTLVVQSRVDLISAFACVLVIASLSVSIASKVRLKGLPQER